MSFTARHIRIYHRILGAAHLYNIVPTQAQLNFLKMIHFILKQVINTFPRGNQRTQQFNQWNQEGRFINRLELARMNMNMRGRRVSNQSNRTRN